MPRLVPVETGEPSHLDAIIKGKHVTTRARLRLLKPSLDARYTEYAGTTAAFELLAASTLAGTAIVDCVDCYNLDRKPVAALKQAILDARPTNRRSLCQWCLIDTWSDLDHFVPKESFPEFAVMARNLAPCCSKCNKAKSDYWPPIGTNPEVISLYYSPLLDQRHLCALVSHVAGQPSEIEFTIAMDVQLSAADVSKLQAHFDRLKLWPRLEDAGLLALSEYREALQAHHVPRADAAKFLVEDAAGLIAIHGPNHPKALTALALAGCDPALDDYTA
jgi:hypothetical protein